MRSIPIDELARIVEQLGTGERVADHFGCSLASARKLIAASKIYKPDMFDRPPDIAIKPLPAPKVFPKRNPTLDPLEWQYEKEKLMMRRGSNELLSAMIKTGQHRLTLEAAETLLRKLTK